MFLYFCCFSFLKIPILSQISGLFGVTVLSSSLGENVEDESAIFWSFKIVINRNGTDEKLYTVKKLCFLFIYI